MTLLFAEHGSSVGCYDYDSDAVRKILKQSEEDKNVDPSKVHGFSSLEKLLKSFAENGQPRILILSLPHGNPVDKVAEELLPLLRKGDIVIDGGNEWWESTERRQEKAKAKGIEWIGMGVSGGCEPVRQNARVSY